MYDVVEEQDVSQEVSARAQLAERVADFVRRNRLCIPYGGSVTRTVDTKGRAYYSVLFSLPHDLDASIGIYSEKFILVRFTTRIPFLAPKDRMVFKTEADLYEFLQSAFIRFDEVSTIRALQKST